MKSRSGCGPSPRPTAPIGVCFSGGIDSGSVFLVTYHVMLRLGMNPVAAEGVHALCDGDGADLGQARDVPRRRWARTVS